MPVVRTMAMPLISAEKKEISYNESTNCSMREISKWDVFIDYHIHFGIVSTISSGSPSIAAKSFMGPRDKLS
jgi:hypothetical protein